MEARLRALVAANGVFTRKDALALGYHDHAIAALVRAGDWVRVRRGAYVFGGDWAAMTDSDRYAVLCRAAVLHAPRSSSVTSAPPTSTAVRCGSATSRASTSPVSTSVPAAPRPASSSTEA
jgi:hypothetical protein